MSKPAIVLEDCSPEVQEQLRKAAGIDAPKRTRTNVFPIDRVRSEAIKVLAVIANLTPEQRKRVLCHAQKMNEV
tara:strand:+ start:710 stop:931 length:222 start_codon:yes stop_codon:yes gene_type:complete